MPATVVASGSVLPKPNMLTVGASPLYVSAAKLPVMPEVKPEPVMRLPVMAAALSSSVVKLSSLAMVDGIIRVKLCARASPAPSL